ncbi:MAG: HEAT repeat domain-containing protein [Akkermansiaceae bacterium]
MSINQTNYLAALAGITFFTLATFSKVCGQSFIAPEQSVVEKFERQMIQQLLKEDIFDYKKRDEEPYQKKIREFFAGLKSGEMRMEAISMLDSRYVYIANRELAAELLGPLIRDADESVRARAAKAIGYNRCAVKYSKELIALLDGEPDQETLINVAYAMGSSEHQAFVPHLETMLSHANSRVRAGAANALAYLAPDRAFNHQLRLLEDKDPWVRKAAVRNISRTPGNATVTFLVKMLEDEEPAVREQAVRSLGEMKAASSADALKECLSDMNHGVRYQATLALGEIKQHAQHVARLLNDENVVARRGATIAMGLMGESRYIENLRPLLSDEDEQVRNAAKKSISQLEALTP